MKITKEEQLRKVIQEQLKEMLSEQPRLGAGIMDRIRAYRQRRSQGNQPSPSVDPNDRFKPSPEQAAQIAQRMQQVSSPENAKPETAAKTTQDLKGLITDPTQRRMLLTGLMALLTNDSVERALSILKPDAARTAVLAFLKQVIDLEPKAYEKIKKGMQSKIYNDMLAADPYTANRTSKRDYNLDFARRQKQAAAGKSVSGELGKLGLSENVNKEFAEKVAILEALDLYFERKSSK